MTRSEALQRLIETRMKWPQTYDEAVQAPDEDPAYEPDYWWHQDEQSGEVYLACDDFDNITRQEWSDARRRALNRPEAWPDGAKVLVQVPDGMWIFGTFADAEPADEGWQGIPPGTWLTEGQTRGNPNVAGWHWEASLVRREDSDFPFDDTKSEDVIADTFDISEDQGPEEGDGSILAIPNDRSRYQRHLRVMLTQGDIAKGFVSINLDPYRMARFLGIQGGPHEQILKKVMTDTSDERQLIAEIRSTLNRWETMLDEEKRIFW